MSSAGKDAFIAALGGPDAICHGVTAQQLADRLEVLLRRLTSPGSRVYRPSHNRELFWEGLVDLYE